MNNLSQLDGREKDRIPNELREILSEFGLMKRRVIIEIEYYKSLCKQLNKKIKVSPDSIYINFSEKDFNRIKEIEKITNHDMKSVEYFLRERFEEIGENQNLEMIHFGLTSDDINNVAWNLQVIDSLEAIYEKFENFLALLDELVLEHQDVKMLARTHGQPASITTLGKELRVFAENFKEQRFDDFYPLLEVKFGGAVGNLSAHEIAFPEIHWVSFCQEFLRKFSLNRTSNTTQINSSYHLANTCQNMTKYCRMINHFCKEMWAYISLNYFQQKVVTEEVGSSTMPQKVNPICFELAEGFSEIAEANFDLISRNLNNTRFQRDLSDHPIHRHFSDTFGYLYLTLDYLCEGMERIEKTCSRETRERMMKELEAHPEVLCEHVQTLMRKYNIPDSYDKIKELSRGKKVTLESLNEMLESHGIQERVEF